MARVLTIDDDEMMCLLVSKIVEKQGHEAASVHTLAQGLRLVERGDVDVVFLDVNLPDGNGLDMIARFRESESLPEVIVITADGRADGAELGIRSGAWDYLDKTSVARKLPLTLARALQYREKKRERRPFEDFGRFGIVGSSPSLKASLELASEAALSSANVLLTGETGTGKELFARAVHRNSGRSAKGFVVVDCAALPKTLAESELFGHLKGAFTGADRSKDGLIKMADGGTLFLDEVGELPLSLQKTFLRALEERRIRPVGAKEEISSDFRLISATNRDLDRMAAKGLFRSDLVYRLRSFAIRLPALREREGDVTELARHFAERYAERGGAPAKGFSPDFLEALASYAWPGNVREFAHAMERAVAAAQDEPVLFPKHLPTYIRVSVARASIVREDSGRQPEPAASDETERRLPTMREYREEHEKKYLRDLLAASKGDIPAACRISGMSRARLYALLKKHDFSRRW